MLDIKKDVLLAPYVTFKIGGPARYFAETRDIEEIWEFCNWAKEKGVPIFVLGGGSNVLISDKGFDGLVIKILNSKFQILDSKIVADAGVPLAKLVLETAKSGLTGLEWAIGIPGTIGGAVCGNTGAYGHSISESVFKVKTNPINDPKKIKEYSRKECGFVYRGSNFKNANEVIIVVGLELSAGNKNDIQKTMKDILSERKDKIPPFPSAGSFFKNYKLTNNYKEDPLIKKFPELAGKIRSGKIATAYLIEQCGLKGKRVGGAMIPEEHSNFIVNSGGATAEDVLALSEICKKKVKEKYDLDLEIEKRLIGF